MHFINKTAFRTMHHLKDVVKVHGCLEGLSSLRNRLCDFCFNTIPIQCLESIRKCRPGHNISTECTVHSLIQFKVTKILGDCKACYLCPFGRIGDIGTLHIGHIKCLGAVRPYFTVNKMVASVNHKGVEHRIVIITTQSETGTGCPYRNNTTSNGKKHQKKEQPCYSHLFLF